MPTKSEKDAQKEALAEAKAKEAEEKAAAAKAAKEEAKAKEEADIEARKRDEADSKGSLSVYDKNGNFVRTYTAEAHGKRAKEYAEEYAGKIGGTVRKAK